jgi:hypothetical protein
VIPARCSSSTTYRHRCTRDRELNVRHAVEPAQPPAQALPVRGRDPARVYHAAVHGTTTVWDETERVAKAGDKFVEHHAAAIASIAAGAVVFAGCEALTGGVGTVGCAAAAGAVGSLVSYGMSCGSSAGGCSATGALVSAGTGAVGGAVGAL